MKTLTDIKSVVLSSQDKNELYLVEVELTEIMGNQHRAIKMADTTMEQGEAKGNLSLATTLVGICRERQEEIKATEREEKNLANKINYNFRMAAKLMLSKDAYDKIYRQAQLTRVETREMKKELNSNKLQ